MNKDLHIVVNPSELSAGTRGSSLGPFAIMTEARKMNKTIFSQFPVTHITNQNQALDATISETKVKYIQEYALVFDELQKEIPAIIQQNKIPILLSGDHASAAGTISALKTADPNKRLGVVWIDAHADIHSPYTTPSGNMHGMPLAIVLGEDNKESGVNTLNDSEIFLWEKLKHSAGISPKVLPQDIVYVGVRDTEEQEDFIINKLNIKLHKVDSFKKHSPENIAESILKQLSNCDWIYISFDVDSMDPKFSSYGTGTPVENGLHPNEVKSLILHLIESKKVGCLEVVEVNPCLDEKKNRMAEIALEILEESINALSKQQ